MKEDKRHLNFRLEPDASAVWDRVQTLAETKLGIKLSQRQLVSLALQSLERELSPEDHKTAKKKS